MPRLTQSRAERFPLPSKGQRIERCSEIKGFAVRLTPGSRVWVVNVREDNRERRIALGPVSDLPCEGTPDSPGARELALLALNASRRGNDAAEAIGKRKKAAVAPLTLNQLWEAIETAGFPKLNGTGKKRPSTIQSDTDRFKRYLSKSIGKLPVEKIDTARVLAFLDKEVTSPGQRAPLVRLIKSMLSFAAARELAEVKPIAIRADPAKEVTSHYKADELAKLDDALEALIHERPHQAAGFILLRVLLHTGCRFSEVAGARWEDVDTDRSVLILERDKASDNGRVVLLPPPALESIDLLNRRLSPFLFPGNTKTGYVSSVRPSFAIAVKRAGLRKLRIHDLRHSFASALVSNGTTLFQTGALLGHKSSRSTQRYSHLAEEAGREALKRVGEALDKTPTRLRVVK